MAKILWIKKKFLKIWFFDGTEKLGLKKRGFRINELYSQMGFFIFKWKKSLGILEIDDWKKEYVKKIKLKKIYAQAGA